MFSNLSAKPHVLCSIILNHPTFYARLMVFLTYGSRLSARIFHETLVLFFFLIPSSSSTSRVFVYWPWVDPSSSMVDGGVWLAEKVEHLGE